ncbi:hypothetical protein ACPXB3_21820 [Gordonia sp. DT219]|uniref:hypothetical protein n=1 Tax=Gordonia sp. DT219 TaxID=3416658 RepID=UPI003CE74637
MTIHQNRLDRFRREVSLNLAVGAVADVDLVTNDQGDCPVIVSLDYEDLSTILGRVRAVGGYGTLFSAGPAGVRMVSIIRGSGAFKIPEEQASPGADATVGMFLDYVSLHPDGVAIPAAFEHPARAENAQIVEMSGA